MSSDIKGVGNFLGKTVKGKVTGESAVKPLYTGNGLLMLESTYKHLILVDVAKCGSGIVVDDGMFLASEKSVRHSIQRRINLSSAAAGGEGLFNLCMSGIGWAVLESPVPEDELIVFNLKNKTLKIDCNMAVCW